MTNWTPNIEGLSGPIYVRIADVIESDIASGILAAGTKLPPQRNLAYDIGVTIGTIGRGYQLALERGLLEAEVGRGTFVKKDQFSRDNGTASIDSDPPLASISHPLPPKLRPMDTSRATDIGQAGLIAPILADITREAPEKVLDYVRQLEPSWQTAGARWMKIGDWQPEPETVLPTQGVHSAIISIIIACTSPGDKIAFEELSYAPIANAVSVLGRRVVPVKLGEDGLDTEDFESVCAQQHPKILVTVPSLHNPTTSIQPLSKRKQIVEIARQHNVMIIEDNIYGVQLPDAPAPIALLAPERTFHVSGLAKSFAAGIRAGWVSCPPRYLNRILVANKFVTGGMPFIITELSARVINSGIAQKVAQDVCAITRSREKIAREIFDGCIFDSHPCLPFLWLQLEEPWLPGTFKAAARENNILISEPAQFMVTHNVHAPHRVRIAFGPLRDEVITKQSLITLRDLAHANPVGYHGYS